MCSFRRKLNRGTGRASPAQDEGQGSASVWSLSLMPGVTDFGGHGHLRWGSSNLLLAARVPTLCLALGLGESLTTFTTHPLPAQLSLHFPVSTGTRLRVGFASAWTWKSFIPYCVERPRLQRADSPSLLPPQPPAQSFIHGAVS